MPSAAVGEPMTGKGAKLYGMLAVVLKRVAETKGVC